MIKQVFALSLLVGTYSAFTADRPNIVWITTEDNSAQWLRLYEENGAPMPNVESLAKNGLVFNNAFSNAPVCSVARSTLLSGCYTARLGAQYHRAAWKVPYPAKLKPYPLYFKDAGYYTANCSKTDYNFDVDVHEIWDTCGWKKNYRNRKQGQPFFQVWSLYRTHEGQVFDISKPGETKPSAMKVFPYHPDTETFRKTYAAYHDRHIEDDKKIGRFLTMLKDDGVLDDTIIFYYGDHGGVMPRSKGYVYESGLQVPLVVSAGKNWKHLLPEKDGGRIDGFVNFVDFAATVMNLAGIEIPKEMDGQPFLGKGVTLKALNARDESFGNADRFDEKYDLVRSYRKGRFKYIRNYQSFNIDGLENNYRYKQAAYTELRELYLAGKLNNIQKQFFEKRAAESLYDLENDPHEINNLVGNPKYVKTVAAMRTALTAHLKSLPDLSFYPESYLITHAFANPVEFGQNHKADISTFIDIADYSLKPFLEVKRAVASALRSEDAVKRYWGSIVCSTFGQKAASFRNVAVKMAERDSSLLVRVRAAEFLALTGDYNPVPVIHDALSKAEHKMEALLILNTASLLKTLKPELQFSFDYRSFPEEWLERKERSWLALRSLYISKKAN